MCLSVVQIACLLCRQTLQNKGLAILERGTLHNAYGEVQFTTMRYVHFKIESDTGIAQLIGTPNVVVNHTVISLLEYHTH